MKYFLSGFFVFVFFIPLFGCKVFGNTNKKAVLGTSSITYQLAAGNERKIAAAKMHDLMVIKKHPVLLQVVPIGKYKCATNLAKIFKPCSAFFGVGLLPIAQESIPGTPNNNRMYALRYRIKLIFPVHYFL